MQTKVTKIAGYTVVEFSGEPATLDLDSYADDSWANDEVIDYDILMRDEHAAIAKLLENTL